MPALFPNVALVLPPVAIWRMPAVRRPIGLVIHGCDFCGIPHANPAWARTYRTYRTVPFLFDGQTVIPADWSACYDCGILVDGCHMETLLDKICTQDPGQREKLAALFHEFYQARL